MPFAKGTNRERVHSCLIDAPQTVQELSDLSGVGVSTANNVLSQISNLGHAQYIKNPDGTCGYILGDGKKFRKGNKKLHSDRKTIITEYLINHIGQEITLGGMCKELKIDSNSVNRAIVTKHVDNGHLTVTNQRPRTWMILPSIKPDSASLPRLSTPLQATLLPDTTSPLRTSDALSQLMQVEQQNIAYRSTIQQFLVIYEQLGNILAAAGFLEDD
jgi:hypothetical protein